MRIGLTICAMLLCLFGLFGPAHAHEVNPAYLELSEREEGIFDVVWKQPLKDGRRLRLEPYFPEACEPSPETLERRAGSVVARWTINCTLEDGALGIAGLDRTLTDVIVRIDRLDEPTATNILKPSSPSLNLGDETSSAPLFAYLRIGVDHIIFGYDHLLFVLGLCLLVRPARLFLTISAFTVAHSITLGLSTLAGVTLPGPPVESVIAVSLVLLAREAINVQRGGASLTSQYPWVIAFGFGLIHGFGFAGALADIGLPADQEVWALLLFNLGVELGQVVFVIVLLGAGYALWRLVRSGLGVSKTLAAYLVGISGTIWMIERVTAF